MAGADPGKLVGAARAALAPGAVGCDECAEVYRGDTPCERCERGAGLPAAALPAWELWLAGHRWGRDGTSGRLRLDAVVGLAQARGCSGQDLEWALEVEREVWPTLDPAKRAPSGTSGTPKPSGAPATGMRGRARRR